MINYTLSPVYSLYMDQVTIMNHCSSVYQVLHELLALEILTLLLEDPTSDSVEVAVGFLKECGMKLTEISPAGVHGNAATTRAITQ